MVTTTAPPLNVLNHHPLYRDPHQHQATLGSHGQPNYFEDSGGSSLHTSVQPTFSTLPSRTPRDNGDKRASAESAESSNMQTPLFMHPLAVTSHSHTHTPVTRAVLKDPEQAGIIPSATAAREKDVVRPDQPELMQNMRPGSDEDETTMTTTTVTTMQSPGKNSNLCLFHMCHKA